VSRHRTWLTGAAVVVGSVVGLAAWGIGTGESEPPAPEGSTARPIELDQACRLVLAFRDAELGPQVLAARVELRRVVHGLPLGGTPAEAAVRTYADATLGPPTAGPARYLEAADEACRGVGIALYAR
jgi:hypothetical protein